MKKYTHLIYAMLFLLSSLVACDREKIDYGLDGNGNPIEGVGKLNLSFQLSVSVQTKASDDVNDFKVKILNAVGELVGQEYTYGTMPAMIELNAGSYTVQASSDIDPDTNRNEAYYLGIQPFQIKKDEITLVDKIVCTMNNIRVELIVDDTLSEFLDTYEITATFNPGEEEISYSFDNTDGKTGNVYFPSVTGADIIFIQFKGNSVANGSISRNFTYPNVEAGKYHRITFTYTDPGTGPNTGNGSVDLDVDADCEIVDDDGTTIKVPGITDPGTGPGPEPAGEIKITGNSFNGVEFDIDQPVVIDGFAELVVLIEAEKGIKNLFVTISSTNEGFMGAIQQLKLQNEFDLVDPGDLADTLSKSIEEGGLGLPVKENVEGEISVPFEITAFTGLLGMFGPSTNDFKLRVVDMDGAEVSKTLTLVIEE